MMRRSRRLVRLFILVLALLLASCTSAKSHARSTVPTPSSTASSGNSVPPSTSAIISGDSSGGASNSPPASTNAQSFPDHEPGPQDVSLVEGHVRVTPNFHYQVRCERPCWLSLYPSPQEVAGTAVTIDFPYERYLRNPGDSLEAACQFTAGSGETPQKQLAHGYRVQDKRGVSSNVWDKLIVPAGAGASGFAFISTKSMAGLKPVPNRPGNYYAYGANLWLGNTKLHVKSC